jgi:hypothetical protein
MGVCAIFTGTVCRNLSTRKLEARNPQVNWAEPAVSKLPSRWLQKDLWPAGKEEHHLQELSVHWHS